MHRQAWIPTVSDIKNDLGSLSADIAGMVNRSGKTILEAIPGIMADNAKTNMAPVKEHMTNIKDKLLLAIAEWRLPRLRPSPYALKLPEGAVRRYLRPHIK